MAAALAAKGGLALLWEHGGACAVLAVRCNAPKEVPAARAVHIGYGAEAVPGEKCGARAHPPGLNVKVRDGAAVLEGQDLPE